MAPPALDRQRRMKIERFASRRPDDLIPGLRPPADASDFRSTPWRPLIEVKAGRPKG
jgi:hypothetical protein